MAAYQIVLLNGGSTQFAQDAELAVRRSVEAAVQALGLPLGDLAFLSEADVLQSPSALVASLPAVAAYISDTPTPPKSAAVELLQKQAVVIVPLVSDLTQFARLVPDALRPVNGLEADANDPEQARLAGRLLMELRLLRRKRRAFISYRRKESSAVAEQLRNELEARRFEVFLDTYSVEYGVEFQPALWEDMANTDVVVLLNTKTVFASDWVEKEITQANLACVSVLQLIWPGAKRPPGTELATPVQLEMGDFTTGALPDEPSAELTDASVTMAATLVETLRARAHASRRRRVVAELKAAAERNGVEVVLEHDGIARLERKPSMTSRGAIVRLVPMVGFPDAAHLHECERSIPKGKPDWEHLVYDSLGVLAATTSHLEWLNRFLPCKSLAIQGIDRWINKTLR